MKAKIITGSKDNCVIKINLKFKLKPPLVSVFQIHPQNTSLLLFEFQHYYIFHL